MSAKEVEMSCFAGGGMAGTAWEGVPCLEGRQAWREVAAATPCVCACACQCFSFVLEGEGTEMETPSVSH